MSRPAFQIDNSDGPRVTRAWVLHPDIKTDNDRRAPEPALAEAVALAADVARKGTAEPRRVDDRFVAFILRR
ncbi:MAG TPA: hypothetical protein EYQ36_15110, partial [Sulfitobacter sp.]|nr:hypothetical protein [Sulfitobacter sp.]